MRSALLATLMLFTRTTTVAPVVQPEIPKAAVVERGSEELVSFQVTLGDLEPSVEVALGLAGLEHQLATIVGGVPHIRNQIAPPGLDEVASPDRTLQIRVDGLEPVSLQVCDATCLTITAASLPDAVGQLAAAHDLIVVSEVAPPSDDPYIRRATGRASAALFDLPFQGHRDPIGRALELDSSLVTTQWAVARAGDLDPVGRVTLLRRGAQDRGTALALAGEAWALEQAGSIRLAAERWKTVVERAPRDPRFLLPAARLAMQSGDMDLAADLLSKLEAGDPRVLEYRVRFAELAGSQAPDALLAQWQDAAVTDPEPVRRRIALRLSDGDLEAAGAFADELGTRGQAAEAEALRFAVHVNTQGATGLPDLDTADAMLQQATDELQAATALAEQLGHAQNRWARETHDLSLTLCSLDERRLRLQSRELGRAHRGALTDARQTYQALKTTLEAASVQPVLDPQRKAAFASLETAHVRATWSYMSGVRFQTDHIESRTSRCG